MKKTHSVRTLILALGLLVQLGTLCIRSHAAAGDVDLSFDPGTGVNGRITTVLVQADGKVLIAGSFTTVKGLARTNLARLLADGSGDATFMAPPVGTVTALAWQSDGKVLVGGRFYQTICDEFDCYPYNVPTVMRLNANGSLDGSFTPATAEHSEQSRDFRSLVPLPDGRILVGGNFFAASMARIACSSRGSMPTERWTPASTPGPARIPPCLPSRSNRTVGCSLPESSARWMAQIAVVSRA